MIKIPLMRRIKNIHFVGIGGSGMSGIAEVLLNQGYKITGSDQNTSLVTKRLTALGAKIFVGHDATNILGADAVVISSAISPINPEVQAANKAHISVLPRAQMLAELMRFHYGIAVAGTHGKTTTTSLVSSILAEAKLDPTFVIGGILNSASSSARLGDSQYFVVETDESDASFLYFNPMASIITNIDADHMLTYGHDFVRLKQAFLDFLHRLPFYGLAVVCTDDPIIKEILPQISRPVITYGFNTDADVQACDFKQRGFSCDFKIRWESQFKEIPIHLNLPGRHNVLNALAATIIATECCYINPSTISSALSQFAGVGRRMQYYGEISLPQGKILIIDDYGHHPKEISVTIEALRAAWPERRLVLAFQPHRYTRTQTLFEDFTSVLSTVDSLVLMEIYSASENPIPGVDSRALARNIRQRGKIEPIFVSNNEELLKLLPDILRTNDILLLQGAGNIGTIAPQLKEKFGP
ncbi:MAG: UDP-N-acetylmuramate--L-alanine ligase [Coxiellaceae bacterium]|jgi:UDP-N-acetylmuramate--alanine ligase|nr:UDP-N-acetylmuramate--L-alanine ligase [Coxiellaceae bacterium]